VVAECGLLQNCGSNTVRVGQNHICAPYMTVHLVVSLPKIPYTTVYDRVCMVLANPKYSAQVPEDLTSLAVRAGCYRLVRQGL